MKKITDRETQALRVNRTEYFTPATPSFAYF